MKVRHYVARTAVVTGVLVACGGAITSVDGNKQVSTLGPTDQQQLCHDIVNYVETSISPTDMKKFICGISLSTSSDPAACQSKFTTCMNDPNKNISYSTMVNCNGFSTTLLKCTGVTVSQFTNCYKQEIDIIKIYASKMPICDRAAAQAAALDAVKNISQECLQVFQKCSISTGGGTGDPPPPPPADAGLQDAGAGPG